MFFLQEKKIEHLKRFSLEKGDLDMTKVCDFMHGLEKNNGHFSLLSSQNIRIRGHPIKLDGMYFRTKEITL